MQPRSLQQVLSELDSVYNPQIDNLRKKQSSIPGQMKAEESGLQAKQQDAFGSIVDGARRRGLGFSGIPLGEQARYSATEYMPALARLRQQSKDQAMSLEDAILGIQERRMGQGQQVYQFEQQAAEQRRQFDETMAENRRQAAQQAANNAASQWQPSNGFNNVGSGSSGLNPDYARPKKGGGFEFVDQTGTPISAAAYAVATGVPFRTVLQRMAEAGDGGAKAALNFVGNDFGYDRAKVNSNGQAGLYNALTWGVKPGATVTPMKLANNPRY